MQEPEVEESAHLSFFVFVFFKYYIHIHPLALLHLTIRIFSFFLHHQLWNGIFHSAAFFLKSHSSLIFNAGNSTAVTWSSSSSTKRGQRWLATDKTRRLAAKGKVASCRRARLPRCRVSSPLFCWDRPRRDGRGQMESVQLMDASDKSTIQTVPAALTPIILNAQCRDI